MAKQKAFCIVHATDFQVWKNETLQKYLGEQNALLKMALTVF